MEANIRIENHCRNMMMICPHCDGFGKVYVEPGSSLYFRCPDCGGTGRSEDNDPRTGTDPVIDDAEGAEDAPANP